jgi:hypothetical protein
LPFLLECALQDLVFLVFRGAAIKTPKIMPMYLMDPPEHARKKLIDVDTVVSLLNMDEKEALLAAAGHL